MRREYKSWTRIEYEIACRHYRVEGEQAKDDQPAIQQNIWNAADYSYQAKNHDMHVWSTNERHERFHQIWRRVCAQRGEIPF